ncbi:hypothetical protein AWN76_013975 [Rhodothermaceae bacterium RA]|nr:hypothetical protein AWN76_013975 [Rhodothermaceae bacterium RA]
MPLRLALTGLAVLLIGLGYADGPPPAHTGGFGEPTCLSCHFDGELNAPGGSLAVDGLPSTYTPGQAYPLAIRLSRPGVQRGGFQLSARFTDAGHQAGRFTLTGERIATDRQAGIVYVRHTPAGTVPDRDTLRWSLLWTAPDTARGPIAIHVAANAANGDDSEFGDYIYALEAIIEAP